MDRELEVIRDEMEHTRANLADKLGALEEQVRETVTSASETVTSTVEGVKEVVDTVSETVESVTETFNISKQVEQHPMLSMGVALATGFALSQLFGGSRQPVVVQQPTPQPPPPQPQSQSFSQLAAAAAPATPTPSRPQERPQEQPHEQGWLDKAASMLPSLGSLSSMLPSLDSLVPDIKEASNTVISGLTGLAVGSVMSVIRDLVAKNLPQDWTGEINKLIDQATVQLGGKPQPVKQEQEQKQEQKGQEPPKHDGKQGEQKSQDRAQEQGRDNRPARNERRQPAHQG